MKFLFDLGGIFFDWDPHHFFKDIFDTIDERKYFLTEVCSDEWNIKQDAGRTIKEAESELIPKFPHYEKEIKLYYKNHRKMLRGTFDTSINVLKKLQKLLKRLLQQLKRSLHVKKQKKVRRSNAKSREERVSLYKSRD